jgi:hypothetical protein
MISTVDLPELVDARLVRHYFFRHPQRGPCSCVLVTDCRTNSRIQYAHVMYVYEQGDFLTGRPCFAVAAEVNRVASPGSGRSHFLGVFPGEPRHINLGASDEWADLERFANKALEVIVEHFSLSIAPKEIGVPTAMLQRFRVPRAHALGDPNAPPKAKTGKWWQFWR